MDGQGRADVLATVRSRRSVTAASRARQAASAKLDARAEANKMLAEPRSLLNSTNHPQNAAAVQKWHELIARHLRR